MIPITISSGTSAPLAMMSLACRPTGVCGCDRRAQHLAGRELDDAVLLNQPLRLGPLARARRTQKDQSHDYSPPGLVSETPRTLLLKFRPQRFRQISGGGPSAWIS